MHTSPTLRTLRNTKFTFNRMFDLTECSKISHKIFDESFQSFKKINNSPKSSLIAQVVKFLIKNCDKNHYVYMVLLLIRNVRQ